MNILVAYGTTNGHTRKIATWVGEWFRERGHTVLVIDTGSGDDIGAVGYDAYILLGSLITGKHQAGLLHFAKSHREILRHVPSAFISASGTGSYADAERVAQANKCMDDFFQETGWTPAARLSIGGAILYTQYGFLVRMVMKRICKKEGGPTDTSRDHELTDWNRLDAFLSEFLTKHVVPRCHPESIVAGRP